MILISVQIIQHCTYRYLPKVAFVVSKEGNLSAFAYTRNTEYTTSKKTIFYKDNTSRTNTLIYTISSPNNTIKNHITTVIITIHCL